ncbi:MAG: hypothetical protein JWL79_3608 [Frankiales bacterium]|nr:hypothetical protein [Frankiales bacterium]
MKNRLRRRGDDGVTLVLVLVFMLIVGLFTTVALDKAQSTTILGSQIRDRANLQYAMDAGVDRALQRIRDDDAAATDTVGATLCPTVAPPSDITEAGGFTFNGHSITYTCQTLAGRAKSAGDNVFDTNFAIVVTGTNDDSFQSSNAVGEALPISGSVYVAGPALDGQLKKPIVVSGGDIVGYVNTSNCASWTSASPANPTESPANLRLFSATGGYLKTCTEETPAQAYIAAVAPTISRTDTTSPITIAGCKVYFPGTYAHAPNIGNHTDNYFVSGAYQFNADGLSVPNTATVLGGKPALGDVPAPFSGGNCNTMTDAIALADVNAPAGVNVSASGVEWIFSGSSTFSNSGHVSLFTPPAATGQVPINIWAVGRPGDPTVVDVTDPNSTTLLNAKLYGPDASIDFFANSQTSTEVRTGIVAKDLNIGAPSGAGLAIFSPGGANEKPAPPFRTIKITAKESSGGLAANVAVATVSNFSPYTVDVLSWRSQ